MVVVGYLHGIPLWRLGPDWEVKSGEEEGLFACYYHSMRQAVYNRLQAASAGDRRAVHGEERHQTEGGSMLDQ